MKGRLIAMATPAVTALNASVAPRSRYVLRRTLLVASTDVWLVLTAVFG